MHTWIALALVGSTASANIPEQPSWQKDYTTARARAGEAGKPLAVFFGSGETGWASVVRGGEVDSKVGRLLADNYVCVYLDKSTKSGRQLAEAFEVKGDAGVVISDRAGGVQAFHHSGALARTELTAALEKYADPGHAVVTTEGTAPAPTVVAAPALQYAPVQQSYVRPAPVQQSYVRPAPVYVPYRSFGGT